MGLKGLLVSTTDVVDDLKQRLSVLGIIPASRIPCKKMTFMTLQISWQAITIGPDSLCRIVMSWQRKICQVS